MSRPTIYITASGGTGSHLSYASFITPPQLRLPDCLLPMQLREVRGEAQKHKAMAASSQELVAALQVQVKQLQMQEASIKAVRGNSARRILTTADGIDLFTTAATASSPLRSSPPGKGGGYAGQCSRATMPASGEMAMHARPVSAGLLNAAAASDLLQVLPFSESEGRAQFQAELAGLRERLASKDALISSLYSQASGFGAPGEGAGTQTMHHHAQSSSGAATADKESSHKEWGAAAGSVLVPPGRVTVCDSPLRNRQEKATPPRSASKRRVSIICEDVANTPLSARDSPAHPSETDATRRTPSFAHSSFRNPLATTHPGPVRPSLDASPGKATAVVSSSVPLASLSMSAEDADAVTDLQQNIRSLSQRIYSAAHGSRKRSVTGVR
jgi:hypothetical protein